MRMWNKFQFYKIDEEFNVFLFKNKLPNTIYYRVNIYYEPVRYNAIEYFSTKCTFFNFG